MSGRSTPYSLAGNSTGDFNVDFAPQSLGVTNPGSTWVMLPQMVGALPWIAPRQFNAIVPAPRAIRGAIKIDSTSVPSAAYTQDVSDLTPALFTAFEDWQPPTVGVSVAGLFAATVINQNLSQVGGTSLTLNQKNMAQSLPVVIASDQTALSVDQLFHAPERPNLLVGFAFGGGAAQAIVPGVNGQQVFLFAYDITCETPGAANSRATLRDTIPSAISYGLISTSFAGIHSLSLKRGINIGGLNQGLAMDVPAGAAIISGTVAVYQGAGPY